MNEYTYIIFDHKGKRLGKIEFGKRISVPSASEIEEAIKDGFPNGATYKLIVPMDLSDYTGVSVSTIYRKINSINNAIRSNISFVNRYSCIAIV